MRTGGGTLNAFIFKSYNYREGVAQFSYQSGPLVFTETIHFVQTKQEVNKHALDRALYLTFLLVGVSYYKCFPTRDVEFAAGGIDEWQAEFLNHVYKEGLGQFAFENGLTRDELAHFHATQSTQEAAVAYSGRGSLCLQSGGKDSLLVAGMLHDQGVSYHPWYCSSTTEYPSVLDRLPYPVVVARRVLDHTQLQKAKQLGAKNGHVPVTYIMSALAVIQAILLGDNEVILGIAHEGEEPHAQIGDLAINHQWSKTAAAGALFQNYVDRYISQDIKVYSPLRKYSELRVAELFVERCWQQFGRAFSSCNVANYRQGEGNKALSWCGKCPKCANAYLLFAPFVPAGLLKELFGGHDLLSEQELEPIFKGLLDIDGTMKPFECIGEIDELRLAYHMAQSHGGYGELPFTVPASNFDYFRQYGQ